MVGMRSSISTLFLLAGCVTPKAIGDTPDTDTDAEVTASSSDDSGDPTGEPLQCPDNPGMCADIDHNFCEEDPGGPASLFDADCCPRPRCDGGTACDDGRVCIGVGLYGGGGPSWLECVPDEDGACGCGATLDGATDVRVCIPVESLPATPPLLCTTEEIGTGFRLEPAAATTDGVSTCMVLAVGARTLSLDCEGGFNGIPSFTFADDVDGLPFSVGDGVELTVRSDDTPGRPQLWVRIAPEGSEPIVVLGMGETIVPPGESPPWPEGVAALESLDAGCPTFACGGQGPTWSGRLIRVGSILGAVAVGPGQALMVTFDDGVPPAVLHVYEAHAGNCGPHAGQPAFYTYALIQQQI